jgi:hypothetical protein
MVGFEAALGAYSPLPIAARSPSSLVSESLAMDPLGEVAAVACVPLVVHVDPEGSDQWMTAAEFGKVPATRERRLISDHTRLGRWIPLCAGDQQGSRMGTYCGRH